MGSCLSKIVLAKLLILLEKNPQILTFIKLNIIDILKSNSNNIKHNAL